MGVLNGKVRQLHCLLSVGEFPFTSASWFVVFKVAPAASVVVSIGTFHELPAVV